MRALRAVVALAEMDTVRAERERGLDIVIDDERGVERAEGAADRDQLFRRGALQPQPDDRRTRVDGPPGGVEVGDDRMEDHECRSRPSKRRFARASWRLAWKLSGPLAPTAASSPATPNATSASVAASSGASSFTGTNQPVIALDMQPVPVIAASSGCPFATACTVSPSET